MRIDFVYGHGSGNAFPIVDARESEAAIDWGPVARALADRAGPVGSDGLLLLTAGDATHDFGMRMFNSDGSEAETCLNGLRLVARLGFERLGLTAARVKLRTSQAKVARADDLAPGVHTVRERAGPAGLDTAEWPIVGAPKLNLETIIAQLSPDLRFTAVTMPNPHLVAFVDAVDEAELVRIGEICEAAPAWLPNRANVSFVEMRDDDLFCRTFERGVGLTDSCGSAMAASTVAAALTGRIGWGRDTAVFNKGGLVRAQADEQRMVTLSGNATFEWDGSAEITGATASDVRVTRRFADEVAAWSDVRAALNARPARASAPA
jgi:diaminopimelate epimerase